MEAKKHRNFFTIQMRGAVGGSADPILGSACCMLDETGKTLIVALHIAKDHLVYRSGKCYVIISYVIIFYS